MKKTKTPLLTKEEERILLKNRNTPEARQKLLDANMRFVLRMATIFKGKAPMPALVEAGKKGLIEAIEKYDCEKHRIGFASYAIWWIRAFIVSVIPRG
jgi:DNA-directed RNA polymerase sigma subunit (sigma70/sigma32)